MLRFIKTTYRDVVGPEVDARRCVTKIKIELMNIIKFVNIVMYFWN